MSAERTLVINADDFGFTRDVNAGIVEALNCGVLTSTTLMANGAAFDDAVRLARENPRLDVGCHLVLVGGPSLARPGERLPRSLSEVVRALMLRRIDPYAEFAAQVRKILDAGLVPSHLDTHKHTHLHPAVLNAVCRVSREFGIPWVRRPFDFPLKGAAGHIPWAKRATSDGLQFLRNRFHAVLARHGCRATDHFAGFQITGRFRTRELVALIQKLPAGITELMCHPGHCTDELRAAPTRLKESREFELEALTAPETKQAVEAAGVRIAGFRDL